MMMLPGANVETRINLMPDGNKTVESGTKAVDKEVSTMLDNVFSAGGLILSQVASLTGLEPYMVQNWVKRGFCVSPVKKKYSCRQLCRLFTINALKDALSISDITGLLSSINGHLNDESDDMIADDELYLYLLRVLASLTALDEACVELCISRVTNAYKEPFAGGRRRLQKVLKIMVFAYYSTNLKAKAVQLTHELE